MSLFLCRFGGETERTKNPHQKDGLTAEEVALISREGGSVLAIKWYYRGEIFRKGVPLTPNNII